MQTTITIDTRGPGLTELTGQVTAWVTSTGVREGLLTLFVRHTSASLLIQENADPAVQADLMTFFRNLAPENQPWHTHREEGPDDMPSHIRAAVLPVALTIPVTDGRPRARYLAGRLPLRAPPRPPPPRGRRPPGLIVLSPLRHGAFTGRG